jgi:hypothetical protein
VGMSWDLGTVPLDGSGPPRPYLATGAFERHGRLSPDGTWILCVRVVEGQAEVFVDSDPVPGRRPAAPGPHAPPGCSAFPPA